MSVREAPRVLLVTANSLSIPLASDSVHAVVTSPPYWALRDYGHARQLGLEGLHDCLGWATGDACGLCYVCQMVLVFRELWRVLRPDGTAWVNLGDAYAGSGGAGGDYNKGGMREGQPRYKGSGAISKSKSWQESRWSDLDFPRPPGLKRKDLVGIPWRVAFALQADGWWLRSDVIWSKPNAMPEPARDRPGVAHEYLFLLAKNDKYFFDNYAIQEPLKSTPAAYAKAGKSVRANHAYGAVAGRKLGASSFATVPRGRNKRTVWEIPTHSYRGAHFATFPPALVEPCIKASTSEHGVCSKCAAPWKRVVTASGGGVGKSWHDHSDDLVHGQRTSRLDKSRHDYRREEVGWLPTCKHEDAPRVPAIVLDPFAGSGTALQVARRLGRHSVGIDLKFEYLRDQARRRLQLSALYEWGNGKQDKGDISDLPMFARSAQDGF